MAFFEKLGDIARNIGDKTSDAIETTKLNSKIGAEKTAIAECMRQIGEAYYQKHSSGDAAEPDVAELYAAIDGHNNTIAEAQAEIERIKTESAAQTQVPPAAPVSPADETVCPSCGKANPAGTKFCQECGAKIEPPAEPEARVCPGCGGAVPAASKFCGECGYRFE